MKFEFGDCVLDSDLRELIRGSTAVAIGPKAFDVLLYLLQNRGRVVSRDDLLDAVWEKRIVSDSTLNSHVNAARNAIGDSGQSQSLIRTVARKGLRFVGDVKETSSHPSSKKSRPETTEDLPSLGISAYRPSIAALPFQNMSDDPAQDYFADGVVEDIITALSRIRWLFVIARNSSFTYKGRAVDVRQVGRELGVRYVLEGSVRKDANHVRITGQLIDATTAVHLWAGRFDGSLENIFSLQDQIAEGVVGAISPEVERAEIERAKRKPTDSLDAYDFYLRGMANVHRGTREAIAEALSLFQKALELDEDFASACAMQAWCYSLRRFNRWTTDRTKEAAEAVRLVRRAVELGKDDAVALARSGHVLGNTCGDVDGGIALADRALALNPNWATAWLLSGYLRNTAGLWDEAIECFSRAMRLSPMDPEMPRMQCGMALAQLLSGNIDSAAALAEKAFSARSNYLVAVSIIAASHALANRMEKAQRAMQQLRQLDPALRIANLQDWFMLRRPQDSALFADSLRKAGLPE